VKLPNSNAQWQVLEQFAHPGFPGYSALMEATGCTSSTAVDWIIKALERRGLIQDDNEGGYCQTDSGKAVMAWAGAVNWLPSNRIRESTP
jgi:hypothetical protein